MVANDALEGDSPPPIPDRRDSLLRLVIAERYEIQERIGSGGMGAVYRAKQKGLGREVAVKVLKRELNRDPATFTRFQREAKAMSRLRHPNTVRVFDFGQTKDRRLYLVMELLEGQLLSAARFHEQPEGVGRALRTIRQILASLAEAHSSGIVHRDLKPDNVFLASIQGESEPVVKVLDFGIAKIVHGDKQFDHLETTAGAVFGTPRYMSPEQAQGKELDCRSDLYTVGLLLYRMLTGEAPFMDTDAVVVMARHIRDDPMRPSERLPGAAIPRKVEDLAMKALAKRPEDRFQSAGEFIEAIERVMPQVVTARYARSSAPPPANRRLSRRPARVWVALGVAILAVVGFVAVNTASDDESSLPRSELNPAPAAATAVTDTVENNRLGRAMLSSEPEGASVWREGKRIGMTPMEVRWMEPSEAVIELRKEGYQFVRLNLLDAGEQSVAALVPVEGARSVGERRPRGSKRSAKFRKRKRSRLPEKSEPVPSDPYEKF